MPKETICSYGDCHSTDTPIIATVPSWGRMRYCCELHAAAGLFEIALMRATGETKETLNAIAPILKNEAHRK